MKAVLVLLAALAAPATDPDSGLINAPGWQLVRAHCGACHALTLVEQQRGDRRFWDTIIDRMQRDHGLWTIPAEQRRRIVDYLAEHYATAPLPKLGVRRPPLPASALPPR